MFSSNSSRRRESDGASAAERLLLLFGNLAVGELDRRFVQSRDELELAAPAAALGRKIFSQRVAFRVIFGQQNPPQVRMARKADAHHVVDFPLQELRALPDGGHGRNRRIVFGQAGLHAETAMVSKRVHMIDDFKPLPVSGIVHRANIRQMVERGVGRIVQETAPDRESRSAATWTVTSRSCRIRLDGQHRPEETSSSTFQPTIP